MIAVVVFLTLMVIVIAVFFVVIEGGSAYDRGKSDQRAYGSGYHNGYKGLLAWFYDKGFDWVDTTDQTLDKNLARYNAKRKTKEKI